MSDRKIITPDEFNNNGNHDIKKAIDGLLMDQDTITIIRQLTMENAHLKELGLKIQTERDVAISTANHLLHILCCLLFEHTKLEFDFDKVTIFDPTIHKVRTYSNEKTKKIEITVEEHSDDTGE